MARRISAWPLTLVAALVLAATSARGDVNQQNAGIAWHKADQCAKDAFAKFPDYTPQSNANRESFRRECLRNHRLPEPASNSGGTQ